MALLLHPAGDGLAAHRERSYVWGYGHYGLLAALAAVAAGLELAVSQGAPPATVAIAVSVPVAVFLLSVWALTAPLSSRRQLTEHASTSNTRLGRVSACIEATFRGAKGRKARVLRR